MLDYIGFGTSTSTRARDRRTEANAPTCRRSCLTSLPCRNHRPSLTTPLLTTLLLTQVLLTRLRAGRLGGYAIPISTESGSAATCASVGRGMVRRDSAEAAQRLSVTARSPSLSRAPEHSEHRAAMLSLRRSMWGCALNGSLASMPGMRRVPAEFVTRSGA